MAGSIIGKHFTITTWGESHGKALGVVIDGIPSGLPLTEEDLQPFLNRRKPGSNPYATKRNESDEAQILSGVFEGKTTGTPLSVMIVNNAQISKDYSDIKDVFRPGHADFSFYQKYGFRDYRGGGRSSGRETVGRVIAGAVASKILNELQIHIKSYTKSIGPFSIKDIAYTEKEIFSSPLYMPEPETSKKAENFLKDCMKKKDSAGGVIECRINGMPAGIGEPVFDKLDACLSKAVMSIGAVKAIEIGDGIQAGQSLGSENNDSFLLKNGIVTTKTNHCGGILGGISTGNEIVLKATIKPTPSIAQKQFSVNEKMENKEIEIHGRHDPIIVPRAVVVVESMVAITLLDALMDNMSAKMEGLQSFYKK